jgi:hypothetical protein
LHDASRRGLLGRQRFADRLRAQRVADQGLRVVQEVGDPPQRCPRRARLSDPLQLLLQLPGGNGIQPLFRHLGDREQLVGGEMVHMAALEHPPVQVARQRFLFPLQLAPLVHRTGEELHDLAPVDRDRWPARRKAGDMSQTTSSRICPGSPPFCQECGELAQRLIAAAMRNEQNCLLSAGNVDEHLDLGVPTLAGGLVEADAAHRTQVKEPDVLVDVLPYDPPQAGTGDARQPGSAQNRHLPHQDQTRLLEPQSEGTALARPRHLDLVHAVLRTLHPRHRLGGVAMMVEKVEMAQARLAEAVRRTEGAALRTPVAGTVCAPHLQVQLMRLVRCVRVLMHQLPRWLDADPQQKNLFVAHAVAPLWNPVPSMAQQLTGFHSG